MSQKAEEMRRRLEALAEEGLVPFELLVQCAATRGIEFRGKRSEEVQLRSETFRVTDHHRRRSPSTALSKPAKAKPAKAHPATPERRATLLEELRGAVSTNGLVPVGGLGRTAYHEAGHAVIARQLGRQLMYVEIGLSPRNVFLGDPGGLPDGSTMPLGPAYGSPQAQFLLGGLVAETLAFGGIEDGAETTSDVRRARDAVPALDTLGELWRTTERVLIDRWANVEVLASALRQHFKLSSREVDRLLGET
jgi:hypothetical protein